MRLLEQRINASPLRERFIAGYLVGHSLPIKKFARSFPNIPACTDKSDTGCIVAWDTFAPDSARPSDMNYPYGDSWERKSTASGVHCTNPLTWKSDTKPAPKALHLGAVKVPPREQGLKALQPQHSGNRITALPAPIKAHTSAQCDNWLIVEEQHDPAFYHVFYKGNYHMHDFSLFYMNIRQNAIDRTNAYLEKHATKPASSTNDPTKSPSSAAEPSETDTAAVNE
jgi:hypothetical protein